MFMRLWRKPLDQTFLVEALVDGMANAWKARLAMQARVGDLLRTNNEYLERARRAEGKLAAAQVEADLFHFWTKMIEERPGRLAVKLAECRSTDEYRRVLGGWRDEIARAEPQLPLKIAA